MQIAIYLDYHASGSSYSDGPRQTYVHVVQVLEDPRPLGFTSFSTLTLAQLRAGLRYIFQQLYWYLHLSSTSHFHLPYLAPLLPRQIAKLHTAGLLLLHCQNSQAICDKDSQKKKKNCEASSNGCQQSSLNISGHNGSEGCTGSASCLDTKVANGSKCCSDTTMLEADGCEEESHASTGCAAASILSAKFPCLAVTTDMVEHFTANCARALATGHTYPLLSKMYTLVLVPVNVMHSLIARLAGSCRDTNFAQAFWRKGSVLGLLFFFFHKPNSVWFPVTLGDI